MRARQWATSTDHNAQNSATATQRIEEIKLWLTNLCTYWILENTLSGGLNLKSKNCVE